MSNQIYKHKRAFVGRLPKGSDLLLGITDYIVKHKVTLGEVRGLGAVSRAVLQFFSQERREYETITYDESLEILSLYGNISIRDHDPFPHLHIVLGNKRGEAFGGHLTTGTIVYAAEIVIHEFDGKKLLRGRDPETGLYLWDIYTELIV
jgi:uncharacterized protein